MKMVDGRPVAVRVTGQTSIFVTNFPAAADELYIRELFSGVSLYPSDKGCPVLTGDIVR